ncbi:MAG: hypothetical protein MUQ10_18545, partial [Anaerolineae bacterium]|nr:hypothetical protein [Anaerolineae bacterium]
WIPGTRTDSAVFGKDSSEPTSVLEEDRWFSIGHLGQVWRDGESWIGLAVTGLMVLACYGFALSLPFFFDDLPILTWLSEHSWGEIWTSSESAYYRPLTFIVYKFGQVFAPGVKQVVLHSISLTVLWLNSILLMKVARLCGRSSLEALLGGGLLIVFPFAYHTIPWITALGHPLVTFLILLAVYAALEGERLTSLGWWGVSLLAMALAPFAHESGPVASLIVGGIILLQYGFRRGRFRLAGVPMGVILGGVLNLAAVMLRNLTPGIGGARLLSPECWIQNTAYFLHGLIYPFGPVISWLVGRVGWQDLALVQVMAAMFLVVVVLLGARTRDWRWIGTCLFWWGCAALPAILALEFNYLYISPRLYTLSSVGIVMLWAWVLTELVRLLEAGWRRWLLAIALVGAIITQNVLFLGNQRHLFEALNRVYQKVLGAAQFEENAPLGFVNLPIALASEEQTYALVLENVTFIPWYSNVGEFIEVNVGWRASEGVIFTPVRTESAEVFGAQGEGLDWNAMRQFAIDHRTVWLTRYIDGEFLLEEVGSILMGCDAVKSGPPIRFEGGPAIESVSTQELGGGRWAVTLNWRASGPVDGEIFVHVRDENDVIVAQADGPALGGMVPIWLWQAGDCIADVRIIAIPPGVEAGPLRVEVGVYNSDGRFPAMAEEVRVPEDAVPVGVIYP